MQRNADLDRRLVGELITGVFESGNPEVYLRDTEPGEDIKKFASAHEVNIFVNAALEARRLFSGFAIWYPETRGHIEKKRVHLDPQKCEGHTFRYSVKGWGIILLQLDFEKQPLINCCVSCNSRKKMEMWSGTHADLKAPSLWDMGAVERHCDRLVCLVRELEKQIADKGLPQDMLQTSSR